MTGVVLLYVGAVLIVNGIWLIGQARAAAITARMPAVETAAVGGTIRGGGDTPGMLPPGRNSAGSKSPRLPGTLRHIPCSSRTAK